MIWWWRSGEGKWQLQGKRHTEPLRAGEGTGGRLLRAGQQRDRSRLQHLPGTLRTSGLRNSSAVAESFGRDGQSRLPRLEQTLCFWRTAVGRLPRSQPGRAALCQLGTNPAMGTEELPKCSHSGEGAGHKKGWQQEGATFCLFRQPEGERLHTPKSRAPRVGCTGHSSTVLL